MWFLCCRALKGYGSSWRRQCECAVSHRQDRAECKHTKASPMLSVSSTIMLFCPAKGMWSSLQHFIFFLKHSLKYMMTYLYIAFFSWDKENKTVHCYDFLSICYSYACIHMVIYVHIHAIFMPLVLVCCLLWFPGGHFLYCHSLKSSQGTLYYRKEEKRQTL